jgi:GT2 family glycosyltransferase
MVNVGSEAALGMKDSHHSTFTIEHSTLPKVALVILNWNGRDDVLGCVASLPRLTYANYTATVVDNASADGSVEALRQRFPSQRVMVMEKNLGFCGGNNRGIADALEQGAEYVLLLNNDTEMHPALVDELVRVARSDERIGAVGAKNLRLEKPTEIWGAYGEVTYGKELVRLLGRNAPDGPAFERDRDVDWVIGNGIMMSRKALEAIGGLDESYFGYHEDVEWCARAREHGFRIVYAGRAIVYHRGFGAADPTRKVKFPVLYFLGRNGVLFTRRHASPWQRARYFSLFLANVARLFVLGRLGREARESYRWLLRGFYHGLTGKLVLKELKLQ